MTNIFSRLLSCTLIFLTACAPVKSIISNQYNLTAYSEKCFTEKCGHKTILITHPEAAAAYQSNQMLYVTEPFAISSFAQNAWISPPADMLYPLMIQTLQSSGFFRAVVNTTYEEAADYRFDTQLIELKQDFLKKPSTMYLSVKAVLTDVQAEHIIASRIFKICVPCPQDTPYGGVIAANLAVKQLTAELANFIISHVPN